VRHATLVAAVATLVASGCVAEPRSDDLPEGGPPSSILCLPVFGPTPGTTWEELDRWQAVIERWFYGHGGRRLEVDTGLPRGKLAFGPVLGLDVVEATWAFFNAVIGRDKADPVDVAATARMPEHWMTRVGYGAWFSFDDRPTRVSEKDVERRLRGIQNWHKWWQDKLDNPELMPPWREKVRDAPEAWREKYPRGLPRDR